MGCMRTMLGFLCYLVVMRTTRRIWPGRLWTWMLSWAGYYAFAPCRMGAGAHPAQPDMQKEG